MTDGIYLLLGSNLGDRRKKISAAGELISQLVGKIIKYSGIYESAAWGKISQPAFLNQVVEVSTKLTPYNLLTTLHQIENNLGRVRREKWAERVIDIDILYYNALIIKEQSLIIPHPEITTRRFTLVPLVEIANDFVHPELLKSNAKLLLACSDNLNVTLLNTSRADIK